MAENVALLSNYMEFHGVVLKNFRFYGEYVEQIR
jgi:hypothetical protein